MCIKNWREKQYKIWEIIKDAIKKRSSWRYFNNCSGPTQVEWGLMINRMYDIWLTIALSFDCRACLFDILTVKIKEIVNW